jgi:CxxC-x17-CxxC domain-containing protein
MSFTDETLTCRDCGTVFTFAARDQEFFASKGYKTPSRCPACRQARKGGNSNSSQSKRSTREMYDVTCDSCGRPTQVPFIPSPGRAVRCRGCHEEWKAGGGRYWARCSECGGEAWLPYEPAPDKWVRCEQCHKEHRGRQIGGRFGGSGDGTSSRKTRDIMGNIVDKPSTYNVGPGMSVPNPRSYHVPGIPGRFPKGGKKRGPKW